MDRRQLLTPVRAVVRGAAISKPLDGASLIRAPFSLTARPERPQTSVGIRIGLSKGREAKRRFGLKDSAFGIKKFIMSGVVLGLKWTIVGIRAALERHWDASDRGDFAVEHDIYRE